MENQVFGGMYSAKELLGEGAFGVVYLCEDLRLKREVAVKVLKPQYVSPQDLRMFFDEARRMASLNHENVVRIHYLDEDLPFIAMEYLPGRTLRQVALTPPPPIGFTVHVMRQIAEGMKALHDIGIVHRDLKPANVMVGHNGQAKVFDLGLSRDVSRLSMTESEDGFKGTLQYSAPEVIDGAKATRQSDMFGFGVMLYQLVTGQHPFEAEHPSAVIYNIAIRSQVPIAKVAPKTPTLIQDVVDLCLAKDPADRPDDFDVIIKKLTMVDASAPPQPVSTIEEPRNRKHMRVTSSGYRNPYLNRKMIRRSSEFFGRKQEVGRIYSRLNITPPGSVSIVGDRKIGKSSLLNYIYMKKNRAAHLDHDQDTVMVYIDLQQEYDLSVSAFVEAMIGVASLELRGRVDISGCSRDLAGVRQMVQLLDREGIRLVLLLDEFEAITGNSKFTLEFFSFVRSLAHQYNVAYITSSARDLQKLCHTEDIRDSPFFNIFTPLQLSVLRPEEARDLIRIPSAAAGMPLEEHADRILDLAGYFPFFLQVACSHALEYMEENAGGGLDFDAVGRRFYDEAILHYRFMWDTFEGDERNVMLRAVAGDEVPAELRHVAHELERKHYIHNSDGQAQLFCRSYADFLQTEVAARRDGGSWVRRLFRKR